MAFRPRARHLWATLRAERRTLRQGLVAHTPGGRAGSVAGLTLALLPGRPPGVSGG
jgi:molybdenum-dependent DNA-binding transcriptional regulator ModE